VTTDASPALRITVNGTEHLVRAAHDTPLIYVLRNDLGLKGARFGCGLGLCGACMVLVNGRPVTSCNVPVEAVVDQLVETIEGLVASGRTDALEAAFVAEGAGQCGFCLTGIMVSSQALLDSNPRAGDDEARRALEPNLCRCGIQARALRAIRRVAEGSPR
jgi:aerobic-type carbon monoxide dehydrogenase small subunit (CoxS/CutS family)